MLKRTFSTFGKMTSTLIRIPRPDDWHLHVRDGDAMVSLLKGI